MVVLVAGSQGFRGAGRTGAWQLLLRPQAWQQQSMEQGA